MISKSYRVFVLYRFLRCREGPNRMKRRFVATAQSCATTGVSNRFPNVPKVLRPYAGARALFSASDLSTELGQAVPISKVSPNTRWPPFPVLVLTSRRKTISDLDPKILPAVRGGVHAFYAFSVVERTRHVRVVCAGREISPELWDSDGLAIRINSRDVRILGIVRELHTTSTTSEIGNVEIITTYGVGPTVVSDTGGSITRRRVQIWRQKEIRKTSARL